MKKVLQLLILVLLPVAALRWVDHALGPSTEAIAPVFVDVTQSSKVEYRHSAFWVESFLPPPARHVAPWLAANGVQVAVTDFNRDHYPDIFVTGAEPNRKHKMFLNNRDGSFKDISATAFPMRINDEYRSHKPIFFDCNGDGYQDLLVITNQCPRLYLNEGGRRFADVTSRSGLNACHGHHGNVVDMDGDGQLDLVYASYDARGPTLLDHFFAASTPNHEVSVFRGLGQCRFTRLDNTGISDVGHTHAIGVVDLRGMGRRDLWFVTDYGPDRVFLDKGDGTYENASAKLKHSFSRNGMAFDVVYSEADDRPYVYVSHIFEPPYIVGGNTLWRLNNGRFENRAEAMGVARCAHAWGGKFFDLDNDGREDLAVANGYVSGRADKNTVFSFSSLSSTIKPVMGNYQNWPNMTGATHFGYEENCLFLNRGDHFVTAKSEQDPFLKDVLDGRGVALLDIQRMGQPTLLIGNQLQELKMFTARPPRKNAWVGLYLEGRCSNRDAFGAKVRVKAADKTLTRYYYPSNGFAAQSDPSLLIGLGDEVQKAAIEATVIWPSGFQETRSDLKANQYNEWTEGAGCEIRQAGSR